MADRIDAVLDHVAIAVADWSTAERRWREQLGGGRSSVGENPIFISRQLQYANGAKLELLCPSPQDASPSNFVRQFLDRFGSAVHHVTLKVPDLHAALDVLAGGGLDAVDVRDDVDYWKEAFLRPSQVGGLVVQIAQTSFDDDDWAAYTGFTREPPHAGAAALAGPSLRHPDLDEAQRLWTLLGAGVERSDTTLRCTWPDSPLDVLIEQGERAGPVHLRMHGTRALPADAALGPAVMEQD
jgi:catechol 2,3-dioxygenase-like lactoylglutathione lyase family enzyme